MGGERENHSRKKHIFDKRLHVPKIIISEQYK